MSFTNPAPGGVRGRTDQGVDWSNIRGNIVAVAGGVITNVYQNLSGFGTTVIERVRGSKPVYYGLETGGGTPDVHAGETVRAGQPIAPGLGTGGIEVGYWDTATGRAAGYVPGVTSGGSTPSGRSFLAQIGRATPNGSQRGSVRATPSPSTIPQATPAGTGPNATLWAAAILQGIGAPTNQANISSMLGWFANEGGGGENNPLNTTLKTGASTGAINSAGVQGYNSPKAGVSATVATLRNYPAIVAALRSGQGLANTSGKTASELSTWSGGGYSSITPVPSSARGLKIGKIGYGGTRPGGESTNQKDSGQGVDQLFKDYQDELNIPRAAPPGTKNPLQWWLMSFTDKWTGDTGNG